MPLINCEINLLLTWSENCIISNASANQNTTFAITDTKRYVPVVTLLTQDTAKLLQQFNTGFKITINWNKYQSKVTTLAPNRYLDYLIHPSFQGVYSLFVLAFDINVNYSGGEPEFFRGRGSFVKLGHFDKHVLKNSRKNVPQGKISEFFFCRYS